MAEMKIFAVVSGANKGIGFDVVRQLASQGITVVLTARDEKRGLAAVRKLQESGGVSGDVIFHQLDVADSSSVASLAEFVRTKFGRLDILVNNAGVGGTELDDIAFRASAVGKTAETINWNDLMIQTYDGASSCLQTNYYGTRRMTDALMPLLQLSQSPRIVNVSSQMGKIKGIPSEWAKGILSDVDNLTEERLDNVMNEFLKDFKEGALEAKGWPSFSAAYLVSKAGVAAYTRMVAKNQPSMKVNCVCPGFVKTDINFNTGMLTVAEGARSLVRLALLPDDGPSGLFFICAKESPF